MDDAHPTSYISFGVVYVNTIARQAMMLEKEPRFPIGSIIVREKLASATATEPQLLSIMLKREKGFNPAGGDWEFVVAKPSEAQLQKLEPERQLQKLERAVNCLSCHGQQQAADFVFRTYLPEDVRAKQR